MTLDDTPRTQDLLGDTELCAGLPPAIVGELARHGRRLRTTAGQFVVDAGQRGAPLSALRIKPPPQPDPPASAHNLVDRSTVPGFATLNPAYAVDCRIKRRRLGRSEAKSQLAGQTPLADAHRSRGSSTHWPTTSSTRTVTTRPSAWPICC